MAQLREINGQTHFRKRQESAGKSTRVPQKTRKKSKLGSASHFLHASDAGSFYTISSVFLITSVTDATDFSNSAFVSGSSLSSRILSTPFFPRTHGTPIETSEKPYSPC